MLGQRKFYNLHLQYLGHPTIINCKFQKSYSKTVLISEQYLGKLISDNLFSLHIQRNPINLSITRFQNNFRFYHELC